MGPAERWRALGSRSRALVLGLLLAAAGAALLTFAFGRDERTPLFAAPLRPEQVAEVAQRLAEWNVAFIAGGDNLRVDARHRNELLLRLSLAGLPHPHRATSSETLEKAGPLVPQSVLDAQQREGLAGDLAAALRGLDGVDDAQVIIAAPRAAAFADETAAPVSAGVRLSLRAGARLTPERIAGIRQFVADGVPGLHADHVALLDDRGAALDDGPPASDDPAAMQASLQSALDEAFGSGATIVRVRLERDPRGRELHSLRRAPLGGAPVASSGLDERYANGKKLYAKRSSAEDRGSDVREERTEIPPGGLDRVSVAVAVDAARGLDVEKIRSLAGATLGLVDGRDVLRVEAVPFARAGRAAASPVSVALGLAATFVPPALLALALAYAARAGARPLERALETLSRRVLLARETRAQREAAGLAPARVRGALRDEPPHAAAAIISALPAATATAVLELYPPEERAAIVRRMQRAASPAVPDYESVLHRA
jgi:type III secretory pathway lipoprotein EscJ